MGRHGQGIGFPLIRSVFSNYILEKGHIGGWTIEGNWNKRSDLGYHGIGEERITG